MRAQIQNFIQAYEQTALWSSTDDSGDPLDQNYTDDDLSSETKQKMMNDCLKFIAENEQHFTNADWATIGHDFWLTRNGHGAGFWDGDYPETQATLLTEAAHKFGECNLYIGDNGMLYLFN